MSLEASRREMLRTMGALVVVAGARARRDTR